MRTALATGLAALAAAGLVGVYALLGGGDYAPRAVANPCDPRPFQVTRALGGLTERLALSALDGAACDLRISRERLVLALRDRRLPGSPSRARRDAAVRRGLHRAVADARRAGRIGGLAAVALDTTIDVLPVRPLLDRLLRSG